MNRPPYSARVVAGLLVTTVEETRKLPTKVLTLPMTAVSSVLQAGMRLQQNVAELAIKGDDVLSPLFDKTEEQPEWARFDEDDEPAAAAPVAPEPAAPAEPEAETPAEPDAASGRFALYSAPPADLEPGATKAAAAPSSNGSSPTPTVVTDLDYDSLTLAQVRAKVRGLDVDALAQLAEYERSHRNRSPFVTMIDNRITSQQKKADADQ